jgi:ditrans,polycis-polyprenyl diphosphate synthase
LWPDFDLQHFIKVLLEWQWRKKASEREEAPKRGRSGKGLRLQD